MIIYGENYSWHNFEKVTMAFQNEIGNYFTFQYDGASGIEQSTYIIAALSVAFEQDFRDDFLMLNFPIDNMLFQECCNIISYYVNSTIAVPIIFNEIPVNNSIGIIRPPDKLNVTVDDFYNDLMNIHIKWKNHDGDWGTLESFTNVYNGSYEFLTAGNDWIWGNTTYIWSVNVTDGFNWINETYSYTTIGSRYDVSNNDVVNFQDAGLCWVHRDTVAPYDGLYDVNQNGVVNFQDAGLCWVNRD